MHVCDSAYVWSRPDNMLLRLMVRQTLNTINPYNDLIMYEAKLHKIMEAYEHMDEYPCEFHATVRVKNIEWDEDDIENYPELEYENEDDVEVTYVSQYEGDHSERSEKIEEELASNHEGCVPVNYDTEILDIECLGKAAEYAPSAMESYGRYPKGVEDDVEVYNIIWSEGDLIKHPELEDVLDDTFTVIYTLKDMEDDESIGNAIDNKFSDKYDGCIPESYDYSVLSSRTADDYYESAENPEVVDGFIVVAKGLPLYLSDISLGAYRFSSNENDSIIFDTKEEAGGAVKGMEEIALEVRPI